jgi:anti-anti-sigma factor
MQVDITPTPGRWVVLAPQGRVDGHTAPDFEAVCQAQVAQGAHWLAMDLAGVPYMSSAGLRVLLATLKSVKAHAGGVSLVRPQTGVREVLEISGFLNIFSLVNDVTELA